MNHKVIAPVDEVKAFLKELKELLIDPGFNIKTDLDILLKKSSEDASDPYTTSNTLLDLDFDSKDVVNQLLILEVSEYLETFIDDKDSSLPPFYAFAKAIQSKDVYIKVKIRDRKKCKIFCVSFHYARYPFPQKRPYTL